MILKGSQRSGGADLALHLMNAFDNERIDVGPVRGTVATGCSATSTRIRMATAVWRDS